MDFSRTKTSRKSKLWLFVSITAAVLASILCASVFISSADLKIERDSLRIATVKEGEFSIVVRAPGLLVPREVRWLTGEVGGSVERVLVKPGSRVQKGELIAELRNPFLIQQLEELEWDLEALQAQQDSEIQNLESVRLDQQLAELNAKNQFQSSEMTFKAQVQLREKNLGSISQIDFETIRMRTEQHKAQWDIEKDRTINLGKNIEAQIIAKKAQLKKLRKQIDRAQTQVDNLNIKASIASVVQEVAIEPGQQTIPGGNIAKLVQQDQLIAQLQVPEVQIQNVATGQEVRIDTRSSIVLGKITRVSPSVIEGTVEVDVELIDALPSEARPELTIDAEIFITSIEHTTYVERPSFSQNDRTMRLFRLSEDEKTAQKIVVEFGKGSASTIQIKSGLKTGDKIIVSDQSGIAAFDTLAIVN